MLINRNNLIVWGNTPPEPQDLINLPYGRPSGIVSSSVLLVPGDLTVFYINAPDGLDVGGVLTIALVTDQIVPTVVNANVGTLSSVSKTEIGTTFDQWGGRVTVPSGLKEEYYRLRIGTGTKTYYSNRLWYKPNKWQDISFVASFRQSRDFTDIPYALPGLELTRNEIRIKATAGFSQVDSQIEDYRNVTNGKRRIVSHQQNMFRKFTCPRVDAFGAEGLTWMLGHKDLLLNGKAYSVKSSLNIQGDSPFIFSGEFEAYETAFALYTSC